jgi:hypothetical protein
MPASIFSGSAIKLLKDILQNSSGKDMIHTGTTDPRTSAVSASKGALYLNNSTADVFRKTDDGSSTNWEKIEDFGGGGVNYIANSVIDADTTGFATYADAAGTEPVDGTGGSPTTAISRNTSSPIRDPADLKIAKAAANDQGEGCSYDFTIDTIDQGQMLEVSFDYKIDDSDYGEATAGDPTTGTDLRCFIYDVTNAVLIRMSPEDIPGNVRGKFVAHFQTAPDSTSYRIIWHVADSGIAAWDAYLTNIRVGPPSLAGNGKVISAMGYKTSGQVLTGGFADNFVDMGTGFTIDHDSAGGFDTANDKYVIPESGYYHIGGSFHGSDACGQLQWRVEVDGADTGMSAAHGTSAGSVISGDLGFTRYLEKGAEIQWNMRVGSGITSQAIEERSNIWIHKVPGGIDQEAGNRIVAAAVNFAPVGTSVSNNTNVPYDTVDFDTHGMFTGGSSNFFTIPESGKYLVIAQAKVLDSSTSVGETLRLDIDVNGTSARTSAEDRALVGSVAKIYNCHISTILDLDKGDTVRVQYNSGVVGGTDSGSAKENFFEIMKIQGPSAAAASEKVYARASGNPASASSGNPIIWPTADFDSHNAYGTGTGLYTCPTSGQYRVYGYVVSGNTAITMNIAVDGTTDVAGGVTDSNGEGTFNGLVNVTKGQTISIEPGGTLDVSSGHMCIEKL